MSGKIVGNGEVGRRANAIVLPAGLAWALSYGLNYCVGNQNTYLLRALHRHAPTGLARDWLAVECRDYHPLFTWLARGIYGLEDSGWLFAGANVAAILLGTWLLWSMARALARPRRALATFGLAIGLFAATRTVSVSGSYLFTNEFLPSTIGALGFLGGLAFFLRGAWLRAGLCLAAGGIFHVNYLVLSLPAFGLALLLAEGRGLLRRDGLGRAVRLLGPPLACLVPFALLLLDTAFSEHSARARHLIFKIRSPHHYDPAFFAPEFKPLLGWLLLSLPARWWRRPEESVADRSPRERPRLLLRTMTFSVLAIVAAGTALTTVVWVPAASQLYTWRLAPVLVLLLLLNLGLWLPGVLDGDGRQRLRPWMLAPVAIGLWLWLDAGPVLQVKQLLVVLVLAAVSRATPRLVPWNRDGRALPLAGALAILCLLVGAVYPLKRLKSGSSLLTGPPPAEATLYEWAAGTPSDALFLIPPDLSRFRMLTRRSVVVDWKSTPLVADEVVRWYRRLEDLSGVEEPWGLPPIVEGYAARDAEALFALGQRYGADYAVVRTGGAAAVEQTSAPVFANEKFQVLSLR